MGLDQTFLNEKDRSLAKNNNNEIDALQARPRGQRQNSARLFRDSLWNGAEIKNPKQSLGLNWLR